MSAWAADAPERLAAWRQLGALAQRDRAAEGSRGPRWAGRLGPLLVDCSRQGVDGNTREALVALAVESGLDAAIRDLFAGAVVNSTEGRAAEHPTLRLPNGACPPGVEQARSRFLSIAEAVRSGRRRGFAGRPFETVLHIGIGGSHLGPELCVQALGGADSPTIRFLANVDGAAATRTLAGLDPRTTLVVVASKSFKTAETRRNAQTAMSWFLERTCERDAVSGHFIAVTADARAAAEFGFPPESCLPMQDGIGGRFSLWSAAGLPIAIALGRDGFEALLAGAHLVDRHFRAAPLDENLPVRLALLQVWNTNFRDAATHAVLAYDHRLRLLPAFLQQLEMESNGKSVRRDGEAVGTQTSPVVWGGEGTNGQHAFHQLLHQGTRAFGADLVACIRPRHGFADHHRQLLANCLAQGEALEHGRASDQAHRQVHGGHPTTTILLDELTPRALGALLALYEHKVFCLGALWQVNSFDQFGVELGKSLAAPIEDALALGVPGARLHGSEDPTTAGLLAAIRAREGL